MVLASRGQLTRQSLADAIRSRLREQILSGELAMGQRLTEQGVGDQKRVVTPRQARDDGASVLVVGRPISRADDPLASARELEATL